MTDAANLARGRWGEQLAARWYQQRGYEVVSRNWRCVGGEIDLVVERDGVVVIVEVKARRSEAFGAAVLAVDARKQARLRRLAMAWVAAERPGARVPLRFDVAAITGTALTVYEGAF